MDDIKLMDCDGCDLVRYCSDVCRQDHKSEHEEACKKRAAELRDELLFKQPESSHRGDCPICSLPMPLEREKTTIFECCGKVICNGCVHANFRREAERRLQHTCPFCRDPVAKTDEECDKQIMKRIEMNDPNAMHKKGAEKYREGDYQSAFEYFTKAAEFGDGEAHNKLACLYHLGQGVEKNKEKEIHHFEEAAIAGHPQARYELGRHEWNSDNTERAVKHWLIAASQGFDLSIKALMNRFSEGHVRKEELAAALRAHKAAVDAIKSPQREETALAIG